MEIRPQSLEFRVWSRLAKAFLPFSKDTQLFFYEDEYESFELNLSEMINDKKDFFVEQYIGLKDYRGRKIFAGDIIELNWRLPKKKAQVIWWLNGFYPMLKSGKVERDVFFNFKMSKVIGNIHENPELVK